VPCPSASIPAVPDPKQEIAVGGPLLERVKRQATLFLVRLLRFPYRVLTFPLKELRREIASLRAAAVESLAYVGVELRRIGDLVERGASEAAPTVEETALVGLDLHGPVLVVGHGSQNAGVSLRSRGYDVTEVSALEDWDAGGRRFGAVLYLGEASEPDTAELQRIGEVLSNDGALVLGVASGSGGNGSTNGLGGGSPDELPGWSVAQRIVVARRKNSSD
jgi:hypothetical protein